MWVKERIKNLKAVIPAFIVFIVIEYFRISIGPIAIILITYWLFKRFIFKTSQAILISFSLLFGETIRGILAAGATNSLFSELGISLPVWIGLIWFRVNPSKYPLIFLIIVQLVILAFSILGLMQPDIDVEIARWGKIDVVLRIFALLGLIQGLIQFHKQSDKTLVGSV